MIEYFFAALVGFLLPWQTRLLLRVPEIGGVKWEFGAISLFVSQIILLTWIIFVAWTDRAELRVWCRKYFADVRRKRGIAALGVVIVLQCITTTDIKLTLNAFFCIALLSGLIALLINKPKIRKPFFGAFLMGIMLQVMLAFVQVFVGASFASTLLGIPLRHAADHGAAVLELSGKRYLRAYGGQPHPNIFSGLMFTAALAYAWTLAHVKQMQQKKNIIQFAILIVAALFMSFSRTAWAACAIVIIYLWTNRARLSESHRAYMKWMTGIAIAMVIVFAPFVFSRVVPNTPIEQRSISERVSEFAEWRGVMRAHWLFGTGAWSYTKNLEGITGDTRVPVHSVPLLALAEFGAAGAALLIFAAYNLFRPRTFNPLWLAIIPPLIFDHYLYSMWSGLVIGSILIFLIPRAIVVATTNQEV